MASDHSTQPSLCNEPGKTCFRCKERKPFAEFHRNVRKRDGFDTYCKACAFENYRRTKAKPRKQAVHDPNSLKQCIHCGQRKPLFEFFPRYGSADGRTNHCKQCHLAQERDRIEHLRQQHATSDEQKQCIRCNEVKPFSKFGSRAKTCKRCLYLANRNGSKASRLKKFGLTLEQYQAMNDHQSGKCAICGQPETLLWKGTLRQLAVDHCHATGKVRGLLCHQCNNGIGRFHDSPALLQAAAFYLRRHNSQNFP